MSVDTGISAVIALGVARQVAGRLADGTTTDNIPEGNNNFYFTSGRARVALSGSNGILYDNTTGIIGIENVSTTSNGAMLYADKIKLDTVAPNADVNQNSFSNVLVGAVNVTSVSKTGTLNLISGSGISMIGDNSGKSVTIGIGVVPWANLSGIPSPTITFTGGVTGTGTMTTLGNVSISTTVSNNSHSHTIANVTGLTSSLNNKSDVGHIHSIADISEAGSAYTGTLVVKGSDGVTNKTLNISNGLIMTVS